MANLLAQNPSFVTEMEKKAAADAAAAGGSGLSLTPTGTDRLNSLNTPSIDLEKAMMGTENISWNRQVTLSDSEPVPDAKRQKVD